MLNVALNLSCTFKATHWQFNTRGERCSHRLLHAAGCENQSSRPGRFFLRCRQSQLFSPEFFTKIVELSLLGLWIKLLIISFVGKRCENNLWQKLPEIQGHCIHRICGDVVCTAGNRADGSEAVGSSHHCPGISGLLPETVWNYSCLVVPPNSLNMASHSKLKKLLKNVLNTCLFCCVVFTVYINILCDVHAIFEFLSSELNVLPEFTGREKQSCSCGQQSAEGQCRSNATVCWITAL